jgi:hypothetical protein
MALRRYFTLLAYYENGYNWQQSLLLFYDKALSRLSFSMAFNFMVSFLDMCSWI